MLKRLRSWLMLDEESHQDVEVAEEFHPEGYDVLESVGGVKIRPAEIREGTSVTVWYDGELAQSGANSVFLHYGFGTDQWQDVGEVEMYKGEQDAWLTNVYVNRGQAISFCFKDGAGNWDNNNGRDWTFQVH